MTNPVNTFQPDDPMLITTMQMAFMAENVAILLNICLLICFQCEIKREKLRLSKRRSQSASSENNLPKKKPNMASRTSSSFSRSSNLNRSNHSKKGQLDMGTVYLTWTLLIVGFMFSLSQGLIENWLTTDCGAQWLQWLTFFFFCAHRSLLLFVCLYRLMSVFKGSSYAFPNWFYFTLMALIVIYFIGAYIIYVTNYGITYVNIHMYTGYSGNILCSWSLGVLVTGFVRPLEISLQLALVVPFLYKLWKLSQSLRKTDNVSASDAKILAVFRKLTFLTMAALTTTVVITFGYVNFKPLSFATSLDAVFNSFCVFLMFRFNQKYIRLCFGRECGRCCCVECVGIKRWSLICCGKTYHCCDDTQTAQNIKRADTCVVQTPELDRPVFPKLLLMCPRLHPIIPIIPKY